MQEAQEMQVQPLGQEDPLEEELAAHPNILAWRDVAHGVAKSWTRPGTHVPHGQAREEDYDALEGIEVKQIITKSKIVV